MSDDTSAAAWRTVSALIGVAINACAFGFMAGWAFKPWVTISFGQWWLIYVTVDFGLCALVKSVKTEASR